MLGIDVSKVDFTRFNGHTVKQPFVTAADVWLHSQPG